MVCTTYGIRKAADRDDDTCLILLLHFLYFRPYRFCLGNNLDDLFLMLITTLETTVLLFSSQFF